MRVFVTGASGFIGSAVVPELKKAGHSVIGLARSEESANKLRDAGVQPVRGQIEDVGTLVKVAREVDGVIHLAFFHDDLSKFAESAKVEHEALAGIAGALEGTNKPFLYASGVLGLDPGPNGVATEDTETSAAFPSPRRAGIEAAKAYGKRGVRVAEVRFSPVMHGQGDKHGFLPTLLKAAKEKGYAAYVGDGTAVWPAGHRLDAGKLIALALEKAQPGASLHAVAEEGVPVKQIAEAIGKKVGVPVKSIPKEEGMAYAGFVGMLLGIGSPVSSRKTQETLGWKPTHPGLIADLESSAYSV